MSGMPLLLDRKLRFGDVAHAIEATHATLRNQLTRGRVDLSTGGPGTAPGSHEFSFADLALLTIARKLVEFGVPVEVADGFAKRALLPLSLLFAFDEVPPAALEAGMRGRTMTVWREPAGGPWHCRILPCVAASPSHKVLLISLHEVVCRALARATEPQDVNA